MEKYKRILSRYVYSAEPFLFIKPTTYLLHERFAAVKPASVHRGTLVHRLALLDVDVIDLVRSKLADVSYRPVRR